MGSFLTHGFAYADWVEARSENFIFTGDTSEKKAALIVNELEEYRSILFKALNLKGIDPEVIPVRIYGVKSGKTLSEIKKLTGFSNAAGLYTTTREGPSFLVNISGSFSKNSPARQITYHEYTHHIISTYSNRVYPRWYDEGYADYLSTFQIDKKGVVKIGLANENRALALARAQQKASWLDMDILTNSIRNYPWGRGKSLKTTNTQTQFYAQSWLAVHYIVSNKDYAHKVKDYLSAVNQADAPDNVFETSFGISPDDFGELLKDYFKKNKYKAIAIKLADSDRNYDIKTRRLTKGEANFHRAEAIRQFARNKEGRDSSEKYYQRAIDAGHPPAQIKASRALNDIASKDEDGAIKNITDALAQQPDDSRILQIAGHVYLGQYRNKKTPSDITQIEISRRYLKQSLRANSHNMQAHHDYVSTYAVANDTASKQALYSAEECAYYYKSTNFIDSNLELAEVLLKNDKFEAAKPMLEKAHVWSLSPITRAAAKRALDKAQ